LQFLIFERRSEVYWVKPTGLCVDLFSPLRLTKSLAMLSSLPIDMVYLFIVSYCVWSLAEVGGRQAVVAHNGDIDLVFRSVGCVRLITETR